MQNEPTLDDIPRCSAIGSSTKSLYLCGFAGILKHGVPQGTIRTTWLLSGRPLVRIQFGVPKAPSPQTVTALFCFSEEPDGASGGSAWNGIARPLFGKGPYLAFPQRHRRPPNIQRQPMASQAQAMALRAGRLPRKPRAWAARPPTRGEKTQHHPE